MQNPHLFTCLSCSIAFPSAEEQRVHYRSDHHRYNMKRRVASLPPVSATVFNQKVMERRIETAVQSSSKGSVCHICNKIYTTENAYRSHINSKKHKENESKAEAKARSGPEPDLEIISHGADSSTKEIDGSAESTSDSSPQTALTVAADATEEEMNQTIDQKIAAARARLSPTHCLFCTEVSSSFDTNLMHMSITHSFFIPDVEYLVDINALIAYLGEKIAVGNVCIYCNGKGREFRTMDAVRKHMVDKSHCKIAYDSENDRLEISDFYDFSSSYPDFEVRKKKNKGRSRISQKIGIEEHISAGEAEVSDEGWEDTDTDSGEVDEIVDEDASPMPNSSSDEDDEYLPENEITYGDSRYELVLPSGARIGHRSMRRYYSQSLSRTLRSGKPEDPNSGAAIVRALLADKKSALVPRKGGFGAFGAGTQVVKARNRGEAREAGRHVREFRDQKRREDFKTKVAFINNHQKHFRDPLLQ